MRFVKSFLNNFSSLVFLVTEKFNLVTRKSWSHTNFTEKTIGQNCKNHSSKTISRNNFSNFTCIFTPNIFPKKLASFYFIVWTCILLSNTSKFKWGFEFVLSLAATFVSSRIHSKNYFFQWNVHATNKKVTNAPIKLRSIILTEGYLRQENTPMAR